MGRYLLCLFFGCFLLHVAAPAHAEYNFVRIPVDDCAPSLVGTAQVCKTVYEYAWIWSPPPPSFSQNDFIPPFPPPGGYVIPNRSAPPPGKKDASANGDCGSTQGDPVVVATGNRVESQVDFTSVGEMGLSLTRTFNNYWDGTGLFGRHWLSNFDMKLLMTSQSPTSTCYPYPGTSPQCNPTGKPIWVQRPDGRQIKFLPSSTVANLWVEDKASAIATIVKNTTNGTYTLHSETHTTEIYDASGFPLKVLDDHGIGWTFTWTANHYLTRVTRTGGRHVDFTWSGNELVKVTDAAGHVYTYQYQSVSPQAAALSSFVDPDAARLQLDSVHTNMLPPPGGGGDLPPPPTDGGGTGGSGGGSTSPPSTVPLLIGVTQPGVSQPSINGGTGVVQTTYYYEDSRFPAALTGVGINGTRYSWFTYDSYGRAIETTLTNGIGKYLFAYGADSQGNRTVTVTNPLGHKTVYTYDQQGHRLSIAGQVSAHCPATYKTTTYDSNGYPDLDSDYRDNIVDNDYNAKGQVIRVTENAGASTATAKRVTDYTWTSDNRLASMTVEGDHRVNYTYTTLGRVASVTITNLSAHGVNGQSQTTHYAYTLDASNMLRKKVITGPVPGQTTTYTYDANGDQTAVTDALGHVTHLGSYNALGLPGSVTDPNGAVTHYIYGPRGRVVTVTKTVNGQPQTYKTAYNAMGGIADLWLPGGRHVTMQYDAAYRLISTTELIASTPSPAAPGENDTTTREREYQHDAMGDVTREEAQTIYVSWWLEQPCPAQTLTSTQLQPMMAPPCTPRRTTSTTTGFIRNMDYDELGRLIAVRGNHGQKLTTHYDANGNLVSRTDALGHATRWTYDVFNRRIASKDALGHTTHIVYDRGNRITQVTDPLGHATQYTWDGLGELWRLNSPDTGVTTYSYDAYGRKQKTTQSDNTVSTYNYDALGRITQVTAQKSGSGSAAVRHYTYDACTHGIGHVCVMTDPSGSTRYTYTLNGKLASQAQNIDGSVDGNHIFTTTWSYNNAGQIAQIGYPSGLKVRYAWQAGRIASLDTWLNGAWKRVASYTYQPGGAVASIWYGNGLIQNRLHDDDGRLTGINTASWQHLSYSYDVANRITTIASSGAGNGWSRTYQYDADNRLIGVGPSQQSFAYDANGNRTQHIFGGATSSYHMASGSNRLASITGARARSFQHDAVGHRTQETANGITTTYTWGAFGRLTQASRPSAVAVCKANGICPTLSAGSWSYLTNGLGQRVEKRPTGQGAVRYTFTPNGTLLSQTWLGRLSPGKQYIWANGMPVGLVQDGSLYFISSDHLGRPELVTNTAGSRVWQANNGAFDRKVHINGIGSLNIGFPGQYYQSELGQWYNGHRMYDATTGRYTTSDPLGLAAGVNTYIYTKNNPLSMLDPQGLEGVGSWNNGGTYKTVFEHSGASCGCGRGGKSRANNPHLVRNVAVASTATAVVGIVVINVIGFPEAEAIEGATAIGYAGIEGVEGGTALELMDGLAGEPVISRGIVSVAGAANGAVPGAAVGYAATRPTAKSGASGCP